MQQILDEVYTAHIATLLAILSKASDGAQRSPAGFVRRHARDEILFDLLVEMKAKFGLKLAFHAVAAQQGAEAQTDLVKRTHLKPLGPPG
ncbi:MAG TPA: hypothetical protein VNY05_05575 [Candidatus Acidoferrales bacterium]|nr:hypothetical protein [Candidatus Acidoferrales bacterium]